MSVVGLDLGNANFVISQVQRGGVDVVLNESSNRMNPSIVSFSGNERFAGESAAPHLRMNYRNTVTQVKRLLGRKASEPSIKIDQDVHLPYKINSREGDEVGVAVNYCDDLHTFSPEQVTAVLLQKVKEIISTTVAEKARAGGSITAEAAKQQGWAAANNMDLVISVPPYYTNRMRKAVLDACAVAGVHCLKVINEPTAVALGYGIFKSAKREFQDDKDTKILFVDAGHSNFTASVVAFRNGSLRVLSSVSDSQCGGRDIDVAMAQHFANDFKQRTGCDAWENRKARIKLIMASEKAKKELSPYGVDQASVSVECLMEDTDFSTRLTLEEFEHLATPVADRVSPVIQRSLTAAGVTAADIANVEVVGGASRPRIMKRCIAQALGIPLDEASGHGLSTTINPDEAVSRGAALQCAILSPLFRVKPFEVQDVVPYPIRVSWEGESDNSLVLFNPGDAAPVTRRLTFRRWGAFDIVAEYDTEVNPKQVWDLPEGQPREIARFRVAGVERPADAGDDAQPPKTRVDFRIDEHGCLKVMRAEFMQEIVESPAPADEDVKMESTPAAESDKSAEANEAPKTDEAPTEQATPTEEAKNEKAEETQAEAPKKKRFKRIEMDVAVETLGGLGGLDLNTLNAARKAEHEMLSRDFEIRATQDMRNELESYIYSTRSSLNDSLAEFATEDEASKLQARLTEMEDWLYGDGFDATKDKYAEQLTSLRADGDRIQARKTEQQHRAAFGQRLLEAIEAYKAVLSSSDEQYAHLSDSDRDVLRAATHEAEEWFRNRQDEQAKLPRNVDPVLLTRDIQERIDNLHKECAPIKNKRKPAPPKPAPEPTPEQSQPDTKKDEETPNSEAADTEKDSDVNMEERTNETDDATQDIDMNA